MDFLKSAVASAIAKGPPFPYSFGDRVDLDQSIWTLYNGTKREDGSNCSILSFDVAANKSRLPLARNALKKLKTMRHPGVVKVLDTVETDSYIYVATERLVPLRWHVKRKSLSPETIKWGLHTVASTIKFINDEASSIHGNLKVGSIYTSEGGEWKLGGFEVLSNVKDDEAVIYTYGSLVPDSGRYTPPELARGGWDSIKQNPHYVVDSFNFGTLIFEVFNGDFLGTDQAGQTKNVPPSMQSSYKRLVNANPKARLSVGHFLAQGQRTGAFFDTPLIKLTTGVDNLGVKTETEREAFLNDLDQLTDDFPEDFFKMKVLPELLKSVEFGGGGPKAFGIVMKIAQKLSSEDFETKVTPFIIRMFGNPDRAIRVCLLNNLPLMIDRLSQKQVNDKIFPQMVAGFTDLAPVVRESTLKSVLVIINKLSDRTVNGELLKYLAKTANDEQPGIRTNTTICLGKIARNLGTASRAKVLIAAFGRSLRDPFHHARNAALMALAVTGDCFGDDDCAAKIVPAVSPLLLDREKVVREQAAKTLDVYVAKIRKAAAAMPDTALPPEAAAGLAGAGASGAGGSVPRMSTPQPQESAASASAWAGWAISSFTNKLSAAAGDMEMSSASSSSLPSSPGATAARPQASPGAMPGRTVSASASASALHRQAVQSPLQPPATPSSLARTASSPGPAPESFFPEPEPRSAAGDDADAWGDGDAWGDMDDGAGFDDGGEAGGGGGGGAGDALFDEARQAANKAPASSTATPYGEDEPDFEGWLAAQAQKKKGGGAGAAKVLPKGLAKPPAKKKPVVVKKAPAKKIDMKPKDTVDDDGWGDGW